ncbi:hypothetical protein [Mycoavidus sp. B2-EB]|uniref:hypothetical protein n=1 Tax=Mycoavidus sp. B2-EB TaxID=2651972 RepID=UPI00162711D4|nr:hypothetical protein [Mycoavidus sp. B2-EB]BBO59590.1 hypothetical protein MPB2EB_0711 [Mycoavidus sp. B2-EB]
MLDFNKFKYRLMEFLQFHGLTYENLNAFYKRTGDVAWYIDWKADYNKSFKMDMERLENSIELYSNALSKKDELAAQAGLIYASISIKLAASSPFHAISTDLTKVLNNKNYNWPSFGKNYTTPNKYFHNKISETDQKELVDLNKIQIILMDFVKSYGVTDEELERVDKRTGRLIWGINLKDDFNKSFNEKLLALQIAFDGYEEASVQKDWRAVRAILQRIRLINFQLYNFSNAIGTALENAWSDEYFKWPSFPEDYKVPAHYNYEE